MRRSGDNRKERGERREERGDRNKKRAKGDRPGDQDDEDQGEASLTQRETDSAQPFLHLGLEARPGGARGEAPGQHA